MGMRSALPLNLCLQGELLALTVDFAVPRKKRLRSGQCVCWLFIF